MPNEWAEYKVPQETCPKCQSDNIANEDGPADGLLHVTCHSCSFQWTEPCEAMMSISPEWLSSAARWAADAEKPARAPVVCECTHGILDHELVDHGEVSDHTRILVREKCMKCPCQKWKFGGRREACKK
jgi:hypothetical protein